MPKVSSHTMTRIHFWLTIGWAIAMPVAVITGAIYSVAFISVISIYANFVGHFSSWQASRAEAKIEAASLND